jgi:hypothetical protein
MYAGTPAQFQDADGKIGLGNRIAAGNGDPAIRVLVKNGISIDSLENLSGSRVSAHEAAGVIRTDLNAISMTLALFPIGLRFALDDPDGALGTGVHTLTASRAFFSIKK